MNILVLNYEYPPMGGGAGNAAKYISEHMASQGHSVHVITMRHKSLPPSETINGVAIHRISSLRRKLNQSNVIEMLSFIVSAIFRYRKTLRGWSPDVSIAFLGLPSGAVSWWLKKRRRIPYIVSIRGGDVPGTQPEQLKLYHALCKPFIKTIWRNAQFVVANSLGLRDLALETLPDKDILFIPNGVDLSIFKPGETQHDTSTLHLLFVGRLSREKRVDLLIHALAAIHHESWDLSIVGDGPESSTIKSLIAQRGLSDRISCTGWLDKATLLKTYQRSDIFVFPSTSEGMPNVILEAMACGLPVVTTRIRGCQELIEHEINGLLVKSDDCQELIQAMERLMSAQNLHRRMSIFNRETAQKYSWKEVGERYLELAVQCQRSS